MTVYELIQKLTEFPPDSTVYLFDKGRTEVRGVADKGNEPVLTNWECSGKWEDEE
jgi:hypothetical protein